MNYEDLRGQLPLQGGSLRGGRRFERRDTQVQLFNLRKNETLGRDHQTQRISIACRRDGAKGNQASLMTETGLTRGQQPALIATVRASHCEHCTGAGSSGGD
jgi:hypothetical protein